METGTLLSGMAIGAAAALALDPSRGARRRALMRDKAIRASRVTGEVLDTTMHDLANRTQGIAAESRGWIFERRVDDRRLLERVRAKLGRVCSHPHAIDVEVQDGQVTLRGPVLSEEVEDLLSTAAAVRGVGSVINELEPHDSADGVPALQGQGRLAGSRFDLLQPNWAPGTRALVGAAAVAAGGLAWVYARR
jgi:gas vesicle protein